MRDLVALAQRAALVSPVGFAEVTGDSATLLGLGEADVIEATGAGRATHPAPGHPPPTVG